MESSDCIFCKIANGSIPSKKLYEDDDIIAFDDISPLAPVHFLVVPKKHITSLNEVSKDFAPLLGHMNVVAAELAKEKGVDQTGYRLVINCGKDGGQEVMHLHLHILGGRALKGLG